MRLVRLLANIAWRTYVARHRIRTVVMGRRVAIAPVVTGGKVLDALPHLALRGIGRRLAAVLGHARVSIDGLLAVISGFGELDVLGYATANRSRPA